jgi:drug/metabolite transporter (DMT)-like permease
MAFLRSFALVVVWSSGFIGAELGAAHAAPTTLLTWRSLLVAVVLLPFLLRIRLDRAEWVRQGVIALLCQCLYLAGVFWAAAAGVPAGTSALVAALQPALVLVVAGSVRPLQVLGLVLGTAGVAVTAAGDLRAGIGFLAVLLPFAAMLSLTAGTLLQGRWASRVGLGRTLAVQSLFTAGFFSATGLASGEFVPPAAPGFWGAVVWAGAAGLGSYWSYYLVNRRDGAARVSTVLYLTPAATSLWAVLMFGDELRAGTVVGLLVCGVAVVLLQGFRPRRPGAVGVVSSPGGTRSAPSRERCGTRS